MTDAETPLWERSKENAAPLERGRNVSVLEHSFAAESEEERLEKLSMIQHYERLVRPSEADDATQASPDDDPLIHWLSYIKYHQDNFPSDTHEQFLLLERCFRSMCKVKKYADDVRFIRVCCNYADKTSRALEIFQYLYQQKVGTKTALFYAAWAWKAEKEKDYAFAESTLR